MKYNHLDPAEHARVMVESCKGNAAEALDLAHTNTEFATSEEDRDYWDAVAVNMQLSPASGFAVPTVGAGIESGQQYLVIEKSSQPCLGQSPRDRFEASIVVLMDDAGYGHRVEKGFEPVRQSEGLQRGEVSHALKDTPAYRAMTVENDTVLAVLVECGRILRVDVRDLEELILHNLVLGACGFSRRWIAFP